MRDVLHKKIIHKWIDSKNDHYTANNMHKDIEKFYLDMNKGTKMEKTYTIAKICNDGDFSIKKIFKGYKVGVLKSVQCELIMFDDYEAFKNDFMIYLSGNRGECLTWVLPDNLLNNVGVIFENGNYSISFSQKHTKDEAEFIIEQVIAIIN